MFPRSAFVIWARLTPKATTTQVNASLYSTSDSTEVGNEHSTYLLGLGTGTTGGSDHVDLSEPIYAQNGVYAEIYGSSTDTTEAILTVAAVYKEQMVTSYRKVGEWCGTHWIEQRGPDRFLSSFELIDNRPGEDYDGADGDDDSGTGGSVLTADTAVKITDHVLKTITTGFRYGTG